MLSWVGLGCAVMGWAGLACAVMCFAVLCCAVLVSLHGSVDKKGGLVKRGVECRAGGRLHSSPGGGGQDGHAHAAHLLHHHPLLDHLLSGTIPHL